MNNMTNFINEIMKIFNYEEVGNIDIQQARKMINIINEFFYTNYEGIGKTNALNQEYEYFSDFHKLWELNHEEILSPKIDKEKCEEVADILHQLYIEYDNLFYELYDTASLEKRNICNVRFFTSNQEFRVSINIEKMFDLFEEKPEVFKIKRIYNEPEDFIKNIGLASSGQIDKRIQYAKKSAKVFIDKNIEPYDLFEYFNKDIKNIKVYLKGLDGVGLGKKKIDMFLRDMIVLKVWEEPINSEIIDVASDVNTMKVALRTGILKTKIPLVSSFLDIFCHQYGLIDNKTALAWRTVWRIWKRKYPNECVKEGPSLLDYLIYKIIGGEFCKEKLTIYECNKGHRFKYKNSRKKICVTCKNKTGESNHSIEVKEKRLPCTDEDGAMVISNSKYVKGKQAILHGIEECPFKNICKPWSNDFVKIRAPKSISIKQGTGWETAYTRKEEGGGGLMA